MMIYFKTLLYILLYTITIFLEVHTYLSEMIFEVIRLYFSVQFIDVYSTRVISFLIVPDTVAVG